MELERSLERVSHFDLVNSIQDFARVDHESVSRVDPLFSRVIWRRLGE